jgi:hypothetical protein
VHKYSAYVNIRPGSNMVSFDVFNGTSKVEITLDNVELKRVGKG